MKVVFRVDASRTIGTGHAIRCLTLAESLSRDGSHVGFICQEQPGDLIAEIRKSGFSVLNPEAMENASGKSKRAWSWLVVDHYGLDRSFETAMRSRAEKILVIDDLADRFHDCDLLLDQNLYPDMQSRYSALLPGEARLLLGPRFALLRPEFQEARRRVRRRAEMRRILVSFGGSDPTNETKKTLNAIGQLNRPDISVDVLVGLTNPNKMELQEIARRLPNVRLLDHTVRISDLMLRADLAIGAGGATSWERCCLGLPSIVVSVAENQEAIAKTLADRGYQAYLGTADEVTIETIADAVIHSVSRLPDTLLMGLNGMGLVDGLGTGRVVEAMKSL